ncbi:SH3 domain-containing protein [Streptomyces sp. NPDC059991]|uniref:SH3 domain-containing protein n=1 Tax=unclassified Streptomyces TaxID=2593676 RepID=UPI0036B80458
MIIGARTTITVALTTALIGTAAITATSASASDSNRCYITASAANVRSRPTTHSTAVGVAYRGWTCDAIDTTPYSTWAKVRIRRTGVVGWVRDDLVHTPGEGVPTCIPEYC